MGFKLTTNIFPRFPVRKSELDRFKFGKKTYNKVAVDTAAKELFCLDVGCGAIPFPKADIVSDFCVKRNAHRRMKELSTNGKPFVLCDGRYLPFRDNIFDFVTSYYLLEHVDKPAQIFAELKRVSKHVYVQCPSWFSEFLYSEGVHKWIISKSDGHLYLKPKQPAKLGFSLSPIFHRLYRFSFWKIIHAILDESFHLFTVTYNH